MHLLKKAVYNYNAIIGNYLTIISYCVLFVADKF